ncbi:MAG: TlpA family protein disulfide reductase [Bryobacter sp.]|jgi:cytochrome c biogenesis protein CcmG/thiol:disulfide interchange protein DsbE|nr:TlpA family protein disulfide reductase [Bryobacter sp. CoA8 C33]
MARAHPSSRLYFVGIAITLAALFYVLADSLTERIVNQGDQATAFQVKTDQGRAISIAEFPGKVLVLNFWASWCKPCVDEMPSLNEFSKRMEKEGVTVLGISVDHDEARYRKFLKDANIAFQTYRDEKADIAASYGTYKYPETYIIDKQGKVVEKIIGEEFWLNPNVVNRIRRLL